MREWVRLQCFDRHLRRYSESRRKGPIYWQLATPSASYSVWLYLHALTKDTSTRSRTSTWRPSSRMRNAGSSRCERARPKAKAAPSESTRVRRRSLRSSDLSGRGQARRSALEPEPRRRRGDQLAPLWRLVPQHKAWQKELKATWESSAPASTTGRISRCTSGRSGSFRSARPTGVWPSPTGLKTCSGSRADGKWKPRTTPTRPVDELVRERTSAAVKAALKSLLEAPSAHTGGARGRGRRAASAAAD